MCGIVGLLIRNPELRPRLGELMLPILIGMSSRGPEAAGLAVFNPDAGARTQASLFSDAKGFDFALLAERHHARFGERPELVVHGQHALLKSGQSADVLRRWLHAEFPELHLLAIGHAIALYKDVGTPAQIAQRYGFDRLAGTHVVGHTRMATESAVTPAHSHPYTAGEDFCLVHNGSLSNPYEIRRMLEPRGIAFETDCDTEAACRFLEWRTREGDDLHTALQRGFEVFDGFYTFLMGDATQLALVRDTFACKPAVVAEHDDYVAIASEFHALAHLPGIDDARIFEPVPEQIYVWKA
ncbi:MAG: class II glutamine amidotransferase [Rubrivivax sp.]|nr:class II glutamine amidotransferase [Rubrivivax sp.]